MEAKTLLENKLIQGIGLAGLITGLKKSFDAAGEFEASLTKLKGTAKIAGVSFEYLEGLSQRAQDQFKLSATVANDLSSELVKLAGKAGDVGKASPALQSFLDIGAARGLTASQTLKAVQQAILGIDEGTDKLFGANPSVLYERFAESIGTTAGKLTDQQKAQAILTAATQDGLKVQGAYVESLDSIKGRSEIAKNSLQQLAVTLGTALKPALEAAIGVFTWFVEGVQKFVGGIQLLAVDVAIAWEGLGPRVRKTFGSILMTFSEFVGESRLFLTIFGDGATELADRMGDAGVRMVRESTRQLGALEKVREESYAEIIGSAKKHDTQLTGVVGKGGDERKKLTKEELAARQKEFDRVNTEIAVKTLMVEQKMTKDMAAEWVRRQQATDGGVKKLVATTAEGYKKIDNLNLLLAAGFDEHVIPAVIDTEHEMAQLNTTMRAAPFTTFEAEVQKLAKALGLPVDQVRKFVTELKGQDASRELAAAARGAIGIAQGLGIVDDKMASVAQNAITFAENIGKAAGGDPTAMIAAIGGLAGVLGSLFGESAETRARKELLRSNTEALRGLERVTGDLLALSTPGAKFAGAETALEQFLSSDAARGLTGSGAAHASSRRSLVATLAGQGLTLSDLEKLAEDLGIGLRNKETGRLELSALQKLLEAIGATEFGQFG